MKSKEILDHIKSAKQTSLYLKAILFWSDSIYMKGNQVLFV